MKYGRSDSVIHHFLHFKEFFLDYISHVFIYISSHAANTAGRRYDTMSSGHFKNIKDDLSSTPALHKQTFIPHAVCDEPQPE